MSDLAQQCEEIRQSDNRRLLADLRQRLPQLDDEYFPLLGNVTHVSEQIDTLLAYIDELKLQVSTLGEQLDQWVELDKSSKATIAEQAKEIAQMRHPSDASDITHAKDYANEMRRCAAVHRATFPVWEALEIGAACIDTVLGGLEAAQREKALVGEALAWVLGNGVIKAVHHIDGQRHVRFVNSGDFDGASPPGHLREVLLQYAGSK